MSIAAPREHERGTGWMRCRYWSVCRRCEQRIETGQWQALAEVPDAGRRWVHETCARELGVVPREPDDTAPRAAPAASEPVRIVVIGSDRWPRDRAVEVRDGIEAVARGHREVVIVHGACHDPRGRLRGVDAWAELTAQRLGYTAEQHDTGPDTGAATLDELRALRPTVVVAFPLEPRPDTLTPAADPVELLAAAAEHAGVPVLVHRPHSTDATTT